VATADIMPVPAKPLIPHPTTGIVASIRAETKKQSSPTELLDESAANESSQTEELDDRGELVEQAAPVSKAPVVIDMPAPPEAEEDVQVSFVLAMIAISLAGIGLVASQFPYGRIGTVALCAIGLVVGFFAMATVDRRWRWPVVGMSINAVALVLATLLPNWLGISAWRPPASIIDDETLVKMMPYGGGPAVVAEDGWVDASKGSWQLGDLRVTLMTAWVGVPDFVLSKDKSKNEVRPKPPKEKKLQISLRLANVGAARRLEYGSWNETAPKEAVPVRLWQTSNAVELVPKSLATATFEGGWDVTGRGAKATIFPGMTCDDLLIFDAPAPEADALRLELPPWAFGVTDKPIETVKIQIPRSMIKSR
jgi:hypothetical protein